MTPTTQDTRKRVEEIVSNLYMAMARSLNGEVDGDKMEKDCVDQLLALIAEERDTSKVTRVEVIDENGRAYVNWDKGNKVAISFQDENRTLKIFITNQGQS